MEEIQNRRMTSCVVRRFFLLQYKQKKLTFDGKTSFIMKYIISTIIAVSLCLPATFAQVYETVEEVVPVLKQQTFYLNSTTRVGGKPRNAIKVTLPENTQEWYYVFTTSKRENSGENLELYKQVADFVGKGLLGTNVVGIATSAAYRVIRPTGAGVVDVYLTDKAGQEQFFATAWNVYSYDQPETTIEEGSRTNVRDATLVIKDAGANEMYICFKNPSSLEGIYVTVEAVALVPKKQYVDTWSAQRKDEVFQFCADALRYQPEVVPEVCDCYKNKVTTRYKPSQVSDMSNQERDALSNAFLEECLSLMGYEELRAKNRIKNLEEEIQGLEAVKDYPTLALRYRELLELGKDSEDIFYGLSRNLLLIQQLAEAKAFITRGLSQYAKGTSLRLNLAHYNLLTGNINEAKDIYQQYKGERVGKKMRWEDAVAEDFQAFERQGITIAEALIIKDLLGLK